MRFTIETEHLVAGLKSAASIARKNTCMPILSFVRLAALEAQLTISATDMEMGFQERQGAEVQEVGEICLPAKILYDIVANLPEGPVEFETDGKPALTIRAASGVYNIPGIKADEFPSLPDLADAALMSLKASDLRCLIHKILFAASTDTAKPHLCGGFLKQEGDRLLAAATDGHKLALALHHTEPPPQECGLAGGVIIPRSALQELLRILDRHLDKTVLIGATTAFFLLRVPGTLGNDITFHVKPIDAAFPDYNRVIPKETSFPVGIRRSALLESLSRMYVLAGGGFDFLELSLADDALLLNFDHPDVGTATESLEVRNLQKTACTTRLDIRYLRAAVEVTHEEEIVLDLTEGTKPLQVMNATELDTEERDYLGIIMPLKC